MKKFFIFTSIFLLTCNISFASSIAEELTKLNNLFKEGAITKEEFSKAKSILLKTEDKSEIEKKKKKSEKKGLTNKDNKKIKKQKIVKKKINEDLTKSYIHLDEIDELGNFKMIKEAPDGMFKVGKSFTHRAQISAEKMYLIFVQQKNLMEKNPENLMKAMGYFEFFYMEQLKKKNRNLARFKEKWPNISTAMKKDMKSLRLQEE